MFLLWSARRRPKLFNGIFQTRDTKLISLVVFEGGDALGTRIESNSAGRDVPLMRSAALLRQQFTLVVCYYHKTRQTLPDVVEVKQRLSQTQLPCQYFILTNYQKMECFTWHCTSQAERTCVSARRHTTALMSDKNTVLPVER